MHQKNKLREKLAELEHEQWQNWSYKIKEELDKIHQLIVNDKGYEARLLISKIRNRWQENWIPYKQLSEKTKDFDREWADKALKIVVNEVIEQSRLLQKKFKKN